MGDYDIGDRRKLTCSVYNEEGLLADPDVLVFTMKEPGNTRTTYTLGTDAALVKDSVGVFHVYWDCAKVGKHFYRWAATGTLGVAEEGTFTTTKSTVLP